MTSSSEEFTCTSDTHDYTQVISKNLVTLSIALAALVAISVIFEVLTGRLEMFLKRKEHWSATINKLYRELMILGFISFLLFLGNLFNVFESFTKIDTGVASASVMDGVFEFVHIAIFMTAIFYIVLVVMLMTLSQSEWNWWDRVERYSLDEIHIQLHDLHDQRHQTFRTFINPILLYQQYNTWNKLQYHKTRLGFIGRQTLPSEFDFALYLRMGSRRLIAKVIELHYSIWLVFLIIVAANALRLKLGGSINTGDGGVVAFTILGVAVFLLSVIVYVKCRIILKNLITFKGPLHRTISNHSGNELLSSYDGGNTHRGKSSVDLLNVGSPRLHKERRHPNLIQRLISKRQPTPYEKLFWLNHPTFLLRLIQFIILFQAIYFTLYTLIFASSGWKEYGGVSIIMILPSPIIAITAFIPTVIPMYTMIRFVDYHTQHELQKITSKMHAEHMQRAREKNKISLLEGLKSRMRGGSNTSVGNGLNKKLRPFKKLFVAFREEVLRIDHGKTFQETDDNDKEDLHVPKNQNPQSVQSVIIHDLALPVHDLTENPFPLHTPAE